MGGVHLFIKCSSTYLFILIKTVQRSSLLLVHYAMCFLFLNSLEKKIDIVFFLIFSFESQRLGFVGYKSGLSDVSDFASRDANYKSIP